MFTKSIWLALVVINIVVLILHPNWWSGGSLVLCSIAFMAAPVE
jgi:hypothetical protein